MGTKLLTAGLRVGQFANMVSACLRERSGTLLSHSRKSQENKNQSSASQFQHSRQAGHQVEVRDFAPSTSPLSHIWYLIQADPAAFLSISTQVFLLMLFPVGEKKCSRNWGGGVAGYGAEVERLVAKQTCQRFKNARPGKEVMGCARPAPRSLQESEDALAGGRVCVLTQKECTPLFLELTESLPTT